MSRTYQRPLKVDPLIFSPRPEERLQAAADQGKRARRLLAERVVDWPPFSPGSLNAWLLFVTTKPPSWRDPLMLWPEQPLAFGAAHESFYYPDPLGFWVEIRRWAVELLRAHQPTWSAPEVLALTCLVHLGDEPDRLHRAMTLLEPRMVVFLDEPSWEVSGLDVARERHHITDPHRKGQVYEGFWGKTAEGVVVGKTPQHPVMHNLYRPEDMLAFIRSAPSPEGA